MRNAMKPLHPRALVVGGLALLGACTSTRTLSVSPADRTMALQTAGQTWLHSTKRNTVAVCILTPSYDRRPTKLLYPGFLLEVRNAGTGMIGLSRDDITVSQNGRPVHCLTSEEYCSEITRRSEQERATIQAAMRSARAPLGEPEHGVDYKGDRVGSSDPLANWGYSSLPQTIGSFMEQGRVKLQELDRRRESLLADARSMMRPARDEIAPGQSIRRVIRLRPADLSPGMPVRIRIQADGETHEFAFEVGS